MKTASLRTSRFTVIGTILIMAIMTIFRLTSLDSLLYLKEIGASTIAFSSENSDFPLFNETAFADSVTLNGFTMYLGARIISDRAITLQRSDQLHIKDLFAVAGTPVVINTDGIKLGIVLASGGLTNCCEGRIGVGKHVIISDQQGQYSRITVADANLLIKCGFPPCTVVLRLREKSVDNLIQDRPISRVSFRRAGTSVISANDRIDSSIIKGKINVDGFDLLGAAFSLRTTDLTQGDIIDISPQGFMSPDIDIKDGALLLTGSLKNAPVVLFSPRGGNPRNLVPNALEVILREPWHKTLWAVVLTFSPLILMLARQPFYRKSEARRSRK